MCPTKGSITPSTTRYQLSVLKCTPASHTASPEPNSDQSPNLDPSPGRFPKAIIAMVSLMEDIPDLGLVEVLHQALLLGHVGGTGCLSVQLDPGKESTVQPIPSLNLSPKLAEVLVLFPDGHTQTAQIRCA